MACTEPAGARAVPGKGPTPGHQLSCARVKSRAVLPSASKPSHLALTALQPARASAPMPAFLSSPPSSGLLLLPCKWLQCAGGSGSNVRQLCPAPPLPSKAVRWLLRSAALCPTAARC